MQRSKRIAPLALVLLGLSACADAAPTAPPAAGPEAGSSAFSEELSLPDLRQSASSGAVRVEVKLVSAEAPLVAREVERAGSDEVGEPERIESRVSAADAQGLTLALGGLRVTFGANTSFASEGGESLTGEEFLAQLQAALAAGRRPAVEAERDAPAEPQSPDDASFAATRLEIDDEASEPRLELNVDGDNLRLDSALPAHAVLRVLGLSIEIRGRETEVEAQRPGKRGRAKFEGLVASADAASGSVVLRDGRVIRVVEGTEIESGRGKLHSIAEVARALSEGRLVEAEGKGILEAPGTWVAVEVEFEVEEEADDVPGLARLRDEVVAVDLAGGTLTLAGGPVVRVVAGTRIRGGRMTTLQRVADAVAQGRTVRAEGRFLLESAGPPARYLALDLMFRTRGKDPRGPREDGDDDPDDGDEAQDVEFEGAVTSVDAVAGTFVLADGRIVRLSEGARIEGDLSTLQAVADALLAGREVFAKGEAMIESEGPPAVLLAGEVEFEVEED